MTTTTPTSTTGRRLAAGLRQRLGPAGAALAGMGRRAAQRVVGVLASRGRVPLVLGAVVVVLLGVYFAALGSTRPVERGARVTFDKAVSLADGGFSRKATFYDEDARVVVEMRGGLVYWATYPRSDASTADLIDRFTEAGTLVEVDQQVGKARTRFVAQTLLPLLILAALFGFVFLFVAGGGGAGEFAGFSSFTRRKVDPRVKRTTFGDVAGVTEAKIELQEVVDYLRDPARYAAMGARAPKGVLLSGPPGTGKTLLARAVAGEANVEFFSLSGSEFVESLVGVGAGRVRDLFRQAREAAPAIIFIDELDAAGRQRGAGMGQGNDEREQTLNQMLVEMDGFAAGAGICVLGATNRPDILDPALLRPGRFDRQVVVDAPDIEGRIAILNLYLRDRPLDPELDVVRVARQTPGFTGAELANLVNEAALLVVRGGDEAITTRHLEEAVDRVIAGPERRSHVLSEDERRLVAYHEAGHAVVAAGVGLTTGVQKLSIVARGRQLGHTTTYQLSDRLVLRASELRRKLVVTLAGPAVEEEVFGEITTGCDGDVKSATDLAKAMVASYGMSDVLGRVAVAPKAGEVFLGRDLAKMGEVSPATLESVDAEIRRLLEEAEADARALVRANRSIVDRIVAELLELETFSGPELDGLLDGVRAAGAGGASAMPHGGRRTRRTATSRNAARS